MQSKQGKIYYGVKVVKIFFLTDFGVGGGRMPGTPVLGSVPGFRFLRGQRKSRKKYINLLKTIHVSVIFLKLKILKMIFFSCFFFRFLEGYKRLTRVKKAR